MFSLLGKKTGAWVGVDIGSSSVKLVALSGSGTECTLNAYAVVPLPAAAVVDGNLQQITEVSGAIEKALRKTGMKLTSAVTAVPSSAVITKKLHISNAFTDFELEDQVRVEADQFIPYPLDEVSLDFEVLGPVQGVANLNEILVVACRRVDVDQREEAISGAGLKCEIIDVDTYAMERAFPLLAGAEVKPGELAAIADIGASTLTLNVFQDGAIVYSREQAFGGNDLINAIHQQYGMTVDEAEQALRHNELSEEILNMLVMPFRQTIAQQVSRSMQFFYSSGAQQQLSRLFISGGTASIAGISEVMEAEVGIPVQVANPFTTMKISSKLNQQRLAIDAPLLLKACGLAMRSFDQ
ncbi:MAG: type IV pilus assembly protein PilM [Oceanospirillaceae bacterium]|nr:type IV pilus assembly protein PilM [Oceanospirillaceae bacterium]